MVLLDALTVSFKNFPGSRIPSPPTSAPPPPPLPVQNGNGLSAPPLKDASQNRMALLGDICNFNKSALRKTKV